MTRRAHAEALDVIEDLDDVQRSTTQNYEDPWSLAAAAGNALAWKCSPPDHRVYVAPGNVWHGPVAQVREPAHHRRGGAA